MANSHTAFNTVNDLSKVNCHAKVDGVPLEVGQRIDEGSKFTIHPNSGYEFKNNGEGFRWKFNTANKYSDYFQLEAPDTLFYIMDLPKVFNTWSVIQTGDTQLKPEAPVIPVIPEPVVKIAYVVKGSDVANLEAQHVTMMVNSVKVVAPLNIYENDVVDFTPNKGHEFAVDMFGKVSCKFINSELDIKTDFQLSDDGSIKWVAVEFVPSNFPPLGLKPKPWDSLELTTKTTPVETKKLPNKVYSISENKLKQFNNNVFSKTNSTGDTQNFGDWIINLIKLPFAIPNEYKGTDEKIKLASYEMGVETLALNTDVIIVDLGSIYTPKKNDNFLDFINAIAVLNLPYTDAVNLDINHVIDQTISVRYEISCYTGVASIIIMSSSVGGVIFTKNVDLGIDVPIYTGVGISTIIKTPNIELGLDNGIKTPYIEVYRNNAILEDGFFTSPIVDESLLRDCKGFVLVEQIELKTKATLNERSKIETLLRSGVIFK